MLASFSSILPSGLGFSNRDERERERLDKERERGSERERGERGRERDGEGPEEVTPRATENDGKLKDTTVDEHGVKKRRERSPNETFIVVRPPPSVSNHPLNLQLQLVPPQAKERSVSGASSASGPSSLGGRPSGDYNAQASEEATGGDPLSRMQSSSSNRSDATQFYASSSASMSSIASTGSVTSTSSGRRMIVPLYNLSAHNVMMNTVLDAGTDAKVAKFLKRGMEILALAVLECVEVWPSYGRSGLGPGHVTFLSASNGANATYPGSTGAAGTALDHDGLLITPTSSAISLSSAGSHPPHPHSHPQSHPYLQSVSAPATSSATRGAPRTPMQVATSSTYGSGRDNVNVTVTPSPSGAKRIFGKIFKKRDSQSPPEAAAGTGVRSHSRSASGTVDVRFLSASSNDEPGHGPSASGGKRRSVNASSPTPLHFNLPPVPTSPVPGSASGSAMGSSKDQPQLQPAVLGIQPTLSAPITPPAGRPSRYVWIVRKWLKGSDTGLLGGVMRGVSGVVGTGINIAGLSPGLPPGQGRSQGVVAGGEVGVEVRFEWVRGQSKRREKRNARKSAQLEKRGSGSTQDDASATRRRARMSLATERAGDGKQRETSQSRGRAAAAGRPATATGAGPPRFSGESRRSGEHDQASRDSRTNSLTSAFSDDFRNRLAIEDDEEESDPEDSETPWVCTLVVSSVQSNAGRLWEHEYLERDGFALSKKESRRSHLSHATEGSTGASDPSSVAPKPPPKPSTILSTHKPTAQSSPPAPPPKSSTRDSPPGTLLKLKVGALSPAPHHPKVVAQVKVPYPLPDIDVTRARIRRRILTPDGVARPVERAGMFGDDRERPRVRSGLFGNGNGGNAAEGEGLVLTAEEIKDILSCTAFWLVVREGFGGVGKVNRKGDGWRIRG